MRSVNDETWKCGSMKVWKATNKINNVRYNQINVYT